MYQLVGKLFKRIFNFLISSKKCLIKEGKLVNFNACARNFHRYGFRGLLLNVMLYQDTMGNFKINQYFLAYDLSQHSMTIC